MDKNFEDRCFSSNDEELSWCFFKQNGNPYVAQDMINERYHSNDKIIDLGK